MNPEIRHALLRVLPFVAVLFFMALAIKRGKIKTNEIGLNKPNSWVHWLLWGVAFLLICCCIRDYILSTRHIRNSTLEKWTYCFYYSYYRCCNFSANSRRNNVQRSFTEHVLHKKISNLHIAIFFASSFVCVAT
jgi:hypothetical protein